jgi:hypothetical protein
VFLFFGVLMLALAIGFSGRILAQATGARTDASSPGLPARFDPCPRKREMFVVR